jgi:hypothetical protein
MSAGFVFIGGFSGVIFGMALIYLSIKITAMVIDILAKKEKEDLS